MTRFLSALICATLLQLSAAAEPAPAKPPAEPPAEQEAEQEAQTEALATEAQNPISNFVSVPFQYNLTPGIGPNEDKTLSLLNIQPVVPFALSPDLTLVTRTILPVLSQPTATSNQNGIGDLNPSFFLVPKGRGAWTFGFGPTLVLPTSSDSSLGRGKWSAGPAAVAVYSKGPWVAGALVNNIWSFAGNSDRSSVSAFLLQPSLTTTCPMAGIW